MSTLIKVKKRRSRRFSEADGICFPATCTALIKGTVRGECSSVSGDPLHNVVIILTGPNDKDIRILFLVIKKTKHFSCENRLITFSLVIRSIYRSFPSLKSK